MAIETSKNILHPCECGCKTPVIERDVSFPYSYRVMCPMCKNEEDGNFMNYLEEAIAAWNNGKWKWDDI